MCPLIHRGWPLAFLLLTAAPGYAQAPSLPSLQGIQSSLLDHKERLRRQFRELTAEKTRQVRDAILLAVKYGNQAKRDETAGYEFAHQKAAYEWGYEVGDPGTVRLTRLYWEGVQLGVFAVGDIQERSGPKSPAWAQLEAMVGGNGRDYTVDGAYVRDIFSDVRISTDGARAAARGERSDFEAYRRAHLARPAPPARR